MTREEHLNWCKERALEYLKPGEFYSITNALTSMTSDLMKHPETEGIVKSMGMLFLFQGMQGTEESVRKFILGFN